MGRHFLTKPKWIYLIALLYVFTPIGNFIYTVVSANGGTWPGMGRWLFWLNNLSIITLVWWSFLVLAGLCLLVVRSWSLYLNFSVLLGVVLYNGYLFLKVPQSNPFTTILMTLATVGFGLWLFMSDFKNVYLEPKLRWWEKAGSKKLFVGVSGVVKPAILVDITYSSLLLEWPGGEAPEDLKNKVEIVLPGGTRLPCEVRKRTVHGIAFAFLELERAQEKALIQFIDDLSGN